MLANRVIATTETLLDPQAALWREAEEEIVELIATQVQLQTSEYIRAVWEERGHGRTAQVRVRALHNGNSLFFRLEWHVAQPVTDITDIGVFADGAGILFPITGDAPIGDMGSESQPVNAWFWRADLGEKPFSVTGLGRGKELGTTVRHPHPDNGLMSRSSLEARTWRVVVGRLFRVEKPHRRMMELEVGMTTKVGFMVLEGANKDRAGLKAYSPIWHELVIEG